MARRPRLFAPGLLYNVIVRGNHKQKTFVTEGDYRAYLGRTWKVSRVRGLVAYVLRQRMGFSVKEVAASFGRDQTSISTLLIRFSQCMEQEPEIKEECERVSRIV